MRRAVAGRTVARAAGVASGGRRSGTRWAGGGTGMAGVTGGRGREPGAAGLPLLIVDAANVVGSVPDGWWRDRRGAAERLRDALAPVAAAGLPDGTAAPGWATGTPLEVVLVVEGAARGVAPVAGVAVESAPGSGDDLIADLAARACAAAPDRPCLVITADRGLRARVTAAGASYAGPRTVPRR